jgi:sugar O-acyltransferase (sialic acid O-acetyltransferase NeuD family)
MTETATGTQPPNSIRTAAVIGAGGHGKVVVSTLRAAGIEVTGVYDDDRNLRGQTVLGVAVRGATAELTGAGTAAVLGIGDNRVRAHLSKLDLMWLTAVHPAAWLDRSVTLGEGTVVFAGAVVQPETTVGRHAIVNTGAVIDHDCQVGDFAHIAPGAGLAGGVRVGTGALLGIGCVVPPGVTVGDWAIVGAGAVVVEDVDAGATVKGVPAR